MNPDLCGCKSASGGRFQVSAAHLYTDSQLLRSLFFSIRTLLFCGLLQRKGLNWPGNDFAFGSCGDSNKASEGKFAESITEDLRAHSQVIKVPSVCERRRGHLEGKLWRGLAEVQLTALGASVASDLQLGVTHILELLGSGKT